MLLHGVVQCSWKSPHPHLPAPLPLSLGDTLSPDSQDTAAAQAPQSALPPETSSAPSWKSENHFIFMHSQHVLQPSPLFETKSPSPPWDQPDRSITESWRSPANLRSSCILCYLHPSPSPTQQTRSWWMNVWIYGWTQSQFLPQTHPCMTLHHWIAQGSSGKASSPAAEQLSRGCTPQNVPSHKEEMPEVWALNAEIPAVPQLHSACSIPEQWHSLGCCWCCGSASCGGITPRGTQQVHLGSYKPCPVPDLKHKISHVTTQVRLRKDRAFLCYWGVKNKLEGCSALCAHSSSHYPMCAHRMFCMLSIPLPLLLLCLCFSWGKR